MCQLLGICANREVDIHLSFREWTHRGKHHPHGYGFVWWHGRQIQRVRDAISLIRAANSGAAQAGIEAVHAARSRIFVAHVRLASVGPRDGRNTHPFQAPFGNRDFAFAHNGTVREVLKRKLRHRTPEGQTDSEHAFLWMLEQLEAPSALSFSRRLKDLADGIRPLGRFNFLMSDGEMLWAYADDALHVLERRPPFGGQVVRLPEERYDICLEEVKAPGERAVLVATEPLTDEPGWKRLPAGTLTVLHNGRIAEQVGGGPSDPLAP